MLFQLKIDEILIAIFQDSVNHVNLMRLASQPLFWLKRPYFDTQCSH